MLRFWLCLVVTLQIFDSFCASLVSKSFISAFFQAAVTHSLCDTVSPTFLSWALTNQRVWLLELSLQVSAALGALPSLPEPFGKVLGWSLTHGNP